jgi:hypothetical protein
MPIRVHQPPEPFTKHAERQPPLFASSDAYRRLHSALRRYVRREIAGRSFLISGHRGSGKTTLVLQAIWDIVQKPQPAELAPLLVRLQGPDLLPDPESLRPAKPPKPAEENGSERAGDTAGAATEPKPPTTEKAAGASGDRALPQSLTERALRQITIAIYRAASQAFADGFERRMAAGDAAVDGLPVAERTELAARFRLALDEAPSPEVLRELYRLGGVLERGVLPAASSVDRTGRGMRELAALASAAAAFRVVSGEIVSSRKESRSAEEERSRSFSLDPATKDLVEKALALLLGGGVGTATLAAGDPAMAALAGVGTALAAAGVLKLSGSRTRKRSASEEYTFLADHDASTLERELPVLIGRLAEAGLAPVFVVDELDKVGGLQERMRTVVSQLKQFVSERAFFCFLTDRDYFEHLRDRALREPYPHEHTYFTDHLFVLFRPADLHEHLHQLLDIEGTEPRSEIDKELLRFLLLHRSKMHAVDLRRELHRMSDADGYIALETLSAEDGGSTGASARALAHVFAVTIQLAIEWLLARDPLRTRLEEDPHFAQPVYDALYYPSRTWEQGKARSTESGGGSLLELSMEAFEAYLAARMNPNRPPPSSEVPETSPSAEAGATISTPLSLRDRELLLEQVWELVELLLDPKRLEDGLDREPLPYPRWSFARDAIRFAPEERVLVRVGEERFAFSFDPYGRKLEPPDAAVAEAGEEGPPPVAASKAKVGEPRPARSPRDRRAAPSPPPEPKVSRDELRSALDLVARLDELVYHRVGMNLSTLATLHVLSAVPTWSQVQEAMARLRPYIDEGTAYPDLTPDATLVTAWLDELRQRSPLLAASLIYGARLGRAVASPHLLERRTRGLAALVEGLRYRERRSQKALQAELERYRETVGGVYDDHASWPSLIDLDYFTWKDQVTAAMESTEEPYEAHHVRLAAESAWRSWKERLEKRAMTGRAQIEMTEADLLCLAAGVPPATELRPDLDAMTIRDWSDAFLRGCGTGRILVDLDPVTRDLLDERPRVWLAAVALIELGLGERAEQLVGGSLFDGGEADEVRSWLRRLERTRPRALQPRGWAVIVSAGDALPVSAAWKPSGRFGALSLSAASPIGQVLASLGATTGSAPVWMVEMPPEESHREMLRLLSQDVWPGPTYVLDVRDSPQPRAREFSEGVSLLGAPANLDEAMEQILRFQNLKF